MTDGEVFAKKVEYYMKKHKTRRIPEYKQLKKFYGVHFERVTHRLGGWIKASSNLEIERPNQNDFDIAHHLNVFAFWTCVLSKDELSIDRALAIHDLRKNNKKRKSA